MAKCAAANLAECLAQSGFVVMRKLAPRAHGSTGGLKQSRGIVEPSGSSSQPFNLIPIPL